MGVVYEAYDHERHVPVALKTLLRIDGRSLYLFKNEFRALADLEHPNLVRLGELVCEAEQWFFTMELIEGDSFVQYVRPGADAGISAFAATEAQPGRRGGSVIVDLPPAFIGGGRRLRSALAQLASGVAAIHAAGKIHRDIKPSNVLVTTEGRVVILDFGLVTDTDEGRREPESQIVGTALYMAPEQATSAEVGAAADWYAVGCVLYHSLTGRPPFSGAPVQVLTDKQQRPPESPRALIPAVPADLDELCMALLRADPAARPSGAEILDRLGVPPTSGRAGARAHRATDGAAPFVGREGELAALRDAWRDVLIGRSVSVVVGGESGVGKSALVARFVRELRHVPGHALVLEGRCYERESVPFKAFDGIVDALSRHLREMEQVRAALLFPDDIALLARVFPVMRRIPAMAQVREPRGDIANPQEVRTRVFAALRALLVKLAEQRPVVLFIDDMQWADADSLLLLGDLMHPPEPPPLLLVMTSRLAGGGEQLAESVVAAIGALGDVRRVRLHALPEPDACALVELLAAGNAACDARAIAAEAGGHPLFIEALVRHRTAESQAPEAVRLDDALWARVARLPEAERQVLQLVAVAGAPLPQEWIADAAALPADVFDRAVGALRGEHLVRTSGARRSDSIEAYHDRVREAVVARLEPADVRRCHERLAVMFEVFGRSDPESLVVHWEGAGRMDRAAAFALEAGRQATGALAFDRAARLYQYALDSGILGGDEELQASVRLAEALANAGRGGAAARAYFAAAAVAPDDVASELRRAAAEQLMLSGRVDEGLEVFDSVLRGVGMQLPATPRRALASLLARRALLRLRGLRYRARDPREVSPVELTRVDMAFSVMAGLAQSDVIRGAEFQARHLLLALRAGEPTRLARACAVEACFQSTAGRRAAGRTTRLLGIAHRLAQQSREPYAQSWAYGAEGMVALQQGRWLDAKPALVHAEQLLGVHGMGVAWELATVRINLLFGLLYLGELGELMRLGERFLRAARDRGDQYAETGLLVGPLRHAWLLGDGRDRFADDARAAIQQWSGRGFHLQHYYFLLGETQASVLDGDLEAAHQRFEDTEPLLRGSLLMRFQILRVFYRSLRGRARIGSALALRDAPTERVRRLRAARADARAVARERLPWSDALAQMLRASDAAARGALAEAAERFTTAARGFDDVGMAVYGGVSHWRAGQCMGGEEGRARIAVAASKLRATGARDPFRLVAQLSPGLDVAVSRDS